MTRQPEEIIEPQHFGTQGAFNEQVAAYYNDLTAVAKYVVGLEMLSEAKPGDGPHLGMHHGFFGLDEKGSAIPATFAQSEIEMNRQVMGLAGFEEGRAYHGLQILDAGSGLGGSAKFIATHYPGTHVHGITISKLQVLLSRALARRYGYADLAEFSQRDYNNTLFADETFDAVHALETLNYALDKKRALEELMRVLRPGGLIMGGDGFKGREPQSQEEVDQYQQWLDAWRVPYLMGAAEFKQMLTDVGFVDVEMSNDTRNVLPFTRVLRDQAERLHPWVRAINLSKETWRFPKYVRQLFSSEGGVKAVFDDFLRASDQRPGGYLIHAVVESGMGEHYLFRGKKGGFLQEHSDLA